MKSLCLQTTSKNKTKNKNKNKNKKNKQTNDEACSKQQKWLDLKTNELFNYK